MKTLFRSFLFMLCSISVFFLTPNLVAQPVITNMTPTTGSTPGATVVTVLGLNFSTNGTLLFNGGIATTGSWGSNRVIFTCPAGQGSNLPVNVVVSGQTSAPVFFSYLAPTLQSLTPTTGPTAGGALITLSGTDFGLSGTVTIGGAVAPVANGAWTHSSIVATLPAGQGANKTVSVNVGGQVSNAGLFSYLPPNLIGITPTSGSTAGGALVTLTGVNFGSTGTVSFGSQTITSFNSWTNTQIVFAAPAGQGINIPVGVQVSGQSSGTVMFSYLPPNLTGINPTTGPTAGGSLVTLTGANLSTNGTLTLGGQVVTNISSWTNTQIVFQTPQGQGANQIVQVQVAGQTSPSQFFSYLPPTLSNLSPANGPTAGATIITLSGQNFGISGSVSVGGAGAILVTNGWSHSQVRFELPIGVGTNRAVVLTSAGRVATGLTFNYDAPVLSTISPATGPAAGGTLITLTGNNFSASGEVLFDSSFLDVVDWTDTQIVCKTAEGQGANHLVTVRTASGSSSPRIFDYSPPQIDSVTATNPTTSGGTTLTIKGLNFGASGVVTVGGVSSASYLSWSDDRIDCLLPVGQGTNQPVTVTVAGQSSTVFGFNYAAPVLDGVAPTSGPTAGGSIITLTGKNFGVSGSVRIGTNNAVLVPNGWSHTQILCSLPEGQGIAQSVSVLVAGQPSNVAVFDYLPPTLSAMNPTTGPTAGGTLITLTGSNFGLTNAATVIFAGQVVTNAPQFWSHTQAVFNLPAGQGINRSVQVNVAGQLSSSLNFSYQPPAISSLSPTNGPTQGGTIITLAGSNFGTSGNVTFNGQTATIVNQGWSDSQIRCELPPGDGENVLVAVTTAGQLSNTKLFSYDAPSITSVSPQTGPTAGGTVITVAGNSFGTAPVVTLGGATVTLLNGTVTQTNLQFTLPPGDGVNRPIVVTRNGRSSNPGSFSYAAPIISAVTPTNGPTSGGSIITLTGANFGTDGGVTIGGFNASIVAGTWSHTQLVCNLPAGQGRDLQVRVTANTQVSAPAFFSYHPPSITGITPTTAATGGGTVITLTGNNFGVNGLVRFGSQTAFPTGSGFSHTNIVCVLPAGSGTNVPVTVDVSGQLSPAFGFSYQPPVITGINPTNGPTVGGTLITLTGSSFGAAGTVTIGGVAASFGSGTSYSHSQIICALPAGQGLNQPVVVSVNGQVSPATNFNYNAPQITSVTPTNGPTAGGTLITLTGSNFGLSGTVRVGDQSAGLTASGTSYGHGLIVCTLPPGQGVNQPIALTVAGQTASGGNFSYNAPVLSSVTPTNGPTAGGTVITLTGNHFGLNGVVTIGGLTAPLTGPGWGQSSIVCLTPPGVGENLPVLVTAGGQVSSAGSFTYLRPALGIATAPGGVQLLWPASATDYVLESGDLSATVWLPLQLSLVTNGVQIQATLPSTNNQSIFRLRRQ